jgi:microcystin-dependent protein
MSGSDFERDARDADFTDATEPSFAPLVRALSDISSTALGQLRSWLEQNPHSIPVERIRGVFAIAVPTGGIIQFGGLTAPQGWLVCDGSAVSRSSFVELFQAIGTSFGAGDGSTTFNLPDMRNRVPVGVGSGTFANLNGFGGAETFSVTLGTANLPAHTHPDGTLAVASHTHPDGTLAVASHAHDQGTLAAASHGHDQGTLAAASHSHSDGTLAAVNHTHGDGTLVVANHNHGGATGGHSNDHSHTMGIWDSAREATGYGLQSGSGFFADRIMVKHVSADWITGGASASHTHAVTAEAPDVAGLTGSAGADVSGATGAVGAGVSGVTGNAAPGVSGITGGSAPDVTGATGATAPDVTGATGGAGSDTAFSVGVLQPYRVLQFIIKS